MSKNEKKKTSTANTRKAVSKPKVESKQKKLVSSEDVLGKMSYTPVGVKKRVLGRRAGIAIISSVATVAVAGAAVGSVLLFSNKGINIKYMVNGKEETLSIKKGTKISDIAFPEAVPGYIFDGWYKDPGLTVRYSDDMVLEEDCELYPRFVPGEFRITYFSNDGTNTTVEEKVFFNSYFDVQENTFTRANYEFVGWSTNPNATYEDKLIRPGKELMLDTMGMNFYAVWRGEERTIHLHNDQGVLEETLVCRYGEKVTFEPLTKLNHTFVGYNTQQDGLGNTYTGTITAMFTDEETDLYAIFVGERRVIEVYGINGELVQTIVCKYGETITLDDVTDVNHDFVKYNTQADANGVDISKTFQVLFEEETTTIYTIWEGKTRSVVLVDYDGQEIETVSGKFGQTVALPAPADRENYDFVGYNTQEDGLGQTYKTEITLTSSNQSITLYALYELESRIVKLINYDGSVIDTITVKYGEKVTISEPAKRINYNFITYNTRQDGAGTNYMGEFSVLFTDATTNLYAIYEGEARTIVLKDQDGTTISTISTNYGKVETLTPPTDKENYEFVGYNASKNGGGISYGENLTVSFSEKTLTLYAIWRGEARTIILQNFDGSTISSYSTRYGSTINIVAPQARQYYTFQNYNTASNGSGTTIATGSTVVEFEEQITTLYAIWLGDEATVSFDIPELLVNGTAYTIDNATLRVGQTYTIPTITGEITNAENILLAFSTFMLNGTTPVAMGEALTIQQPSNVITIKWQDAYSVLHFNLQAPTGETLTPIVEMVKYESASEYGYTLPTPDACVNYNFMGWNTQADGQGTMYQANETFTTANATTTLYAIWEGKSRSIKVETEDGTLISTMSAKYGQTITLPTQERENYIFKGYYCEEDGKTYQSGSFACNFATDTLTLTTIWEGEARTIVLMNYNDTVVATLTGKYGDNITLTAPASRTNYNFMGYSTDSSATTGDYSGTISIAFTNATTTLYAVWEGREIIINLSDGSGWSQTVTVKYGETVNLPEPPAREHFNFEAYRDISGRFIVYGTEYHVTTSESELDLYAYYMGEAVYIHLCNDDGEWITDIVEIWGEEITLPAPEETRENYEFVGYSYNMGDTHANFVDMFPCHFSTNEVTLYAVWQGKERTIEIYDWTGSYYDTITVRYGETFTLPTQTRDNYIFKGYTESSAGTGTVYKGETVCNFTDEDVYLYPVWEGEARTITFRNTDGTIIQVVDTKYSETIEVIVPTDIPNYEFIGYTKSIGDTHIDYSASDTILVDADLNLYAIWQGEERTIILANYDGSIVTTITGNRYGDTIQLTPPANRENYTYQGYTISQDGTGSVYIGTVTIDFNDAITTLYAKWSRNQVTISFNANGATGAVANILVDANTTKTFTADEIDAQQSALYKQYHTLVGWSLNQNAQPGDEGVGFTISVGTIAQTYFAIWQQNEVSVSYEIVAGSVVPTATKINQGLSIILSDANFIRDGYFLKEFMYNGNTYQIGDTITFTDEDVFSVVITPVWQEAYPLTFLGGGEVVSTVMLTDQTTKNVTDLVAGDVIYSPDAPVREIVENGTTKYFVGWATTKGATTPEFVAGDLSTPITVTDTARFFYAVYQEADTECFTFSQLADGTYSVSSNTNANGKEILVVPGVYNGKTVSTISSFYNAEIKHIILPSSITSIGYEAFASTSIQSISMTDNVSSIGIAAFSYCESLTGIKIPASTISVGENTFALCSKLKTVIFETGSQCVEIGVSAFGRCGSLTAITIPASVTSINEWAFASCGSLETFTFEPGSQCKKIGEMVFGRGVNSLTAIAIPASVTSIGNYAFDCPALETVTFAENSQLTTIGDSAFLFCKSLTTINIPASVTSIGERAFACCEALETVTFAEDSQLTTIGADAFSDCTSLRSITIPDNVTTIGKRAFSECTSLSSINISESVTSIGENAFFDCFALETVTFAENSQLTTIGGAAFCFCESLTSINIPANVTSIGESAFSDCILLSSITISDSVTTIGADAFFDCSALETVSISENSQLTTIGNSAFQNCASLTSINIPAGVTSIGNYAFYYCISLGTVTIAENSQLITIGSFAFHNCTSLTSITLPDSVTTIEYATFYKCTSLISINIPASATSIGEHAFSECTSLTNINIPANVTSIGADAFYYCNSLETVTFAEDSQLTTIGRKAFIDCTLLTSINIPAGVTSIGDNAFSYCFALETVTFAENSQLTTIGSFAFSECTSLANINIPASVTSIGTNAFDGCNNIETLSYDTDVFNNVTIIFEKLKTLTIGDNVTTIPAGKFSNCAYLTSVTIGSGVTSIVDDTFYRCSALETVTFAENSQLTTIGKGAFFECASLTSINIPASVTSIEDSAFLGCTSLANINIPANVTSIGMGAFLNCALLETVAFAENSQLTTIESFAFSDCTSLRSITIPDNVTTIGNTAFSNCISLTNINIPANVTSIEYNTFIDCTSLTNVTIPKDSQLTTIGRNAFSECTSLISIDIPASVTLIEYRAFEECTSLTTINYNATACADLAIDSNVFYNAGRNGTGITMNIGANVTKIPAHLCYAGGTEYEPIITTLNFVEPSQCVSIGVSAFESCGALTSVNIPDSVTTIGENAFKGCSALESVSVGTSGVSAGTSSVRSILKQSTQETTIGASAFENCTALKTLTLGDNVTVVDARAFYNCNKLTEIVIPDSVTTINEKAFSACTSLQTLTIGEGVATMGVDAFDDNINLTTINYNAINCANISGANPFSNVGGNTVGVTVNIGAKVARIPSNIFYNSDTGVQKVVAINFAEGSQCTEIGSSVFAGSKSLVSVTIPATVTIIRSNAFEGCTELTTVTFEAGSQCDTISKSAFSGCTKLSAISIPDSVTTIGENAFKYCRSLTSITIGAGVKNIGEYAFDETEHLTTLNFNATNMNDVAEGVSIFGVTGYSAGGITVNVGSNVTRIPAYLFDRNAPDQNIVALRFEDNSQCTEIAEHSFQNCTSLFEIEIPELITSLQSDFIFPASVETVIFKGAPEGIKASDFTVLTGASIITFGPNVTTIPEHMFFEFYTYCDIIIPDNVTTIKRYAFIFAQIKSLTFGKGIQTIEEYAVTNWYDIRFTGEYPPQNVDQWWYGNEQDDNSSPVYVPQEYISNYASLPCNEVDFTLVGY